MVSESVLPLYLTDSFKEKLGLSLILEVARMMWLPFLQVFSARFISLSKKLLAALKSIR